MVSERPIIHTIPFNLYTEVTGMMLWNAREEEGQAEARVGAAGVKKKKKPLLGNRKVDQDRGGHTFVF